MDAELREDVLDVMPHRVRAHVELLGDLPVRRPTREQTGDLRLTPGQPESSERQIVRDLAVVREAHRDSHLQCAEQEQAASTLLTRWSRPWADWHPAPSVCTLGVRP